MKSKYTKTMTEAYLEILERRQTGQQRRQSQAEIRQARDKGGNPLDAAVQAATSAARGAATGSDSSRAGVRGAVQGVSAINSGNQSGGETAAQREARRAKVGLSGNAGADRAQASQAAAQPKIDKVNADRASGKRGQLPSNYKETERQAFDAADKHRMGAGTSALPRSVQQNMSTPKPDPKPQPKPQPKPLDTSGVGSGTSNYSRTPKPTPTPSPRSSGSGFGRRPTGRSEMRAANIAKTQSRPRPTTPKPIPSSARLDAATSGIKPMSDSFEYKALEDAYNSMYQQLDEIPGVVGGLGAAAGTALGSGAVGAGAAGAIKGKDTKEKVKKAVAQGTGAAVGGALGGPIGAVIGGGVGDAVSEAYAHWQEQITAGKHIRPQV